MRRAQSGPNDARAREIFKELIEINTTDTPAGNVTTAAEAMAARLKAAGFPAADIQVLGPDPRSATSSRGCRGTGATRPLLLLAHLDVVEAKREDWSFDPFTFLEKDGFFYGRGTSDDKAMAAQFVANLIRLKEEGFTPDRDLILALTADEEGGDFNGVDWLVKNHRDLIDAEFAINEGGGGNMRKGQVPHQRGAGQRKGLPELPPRSDQPGRPQLAAGEGQRDLSPRGRARAARKFDFPVQLNEVTRAYFAALAPMRERTRRSRPTCARSRARRPTCAAAARLSAQLPYWNSMMRTTCVATMLAGGPCDERTAAARDGKRQLPDSAWRVAERRARQADGGARRSADQGVVCRRREPEQAVAARPDVMGVVESLTKEMFPGAVVVPVMSTGATDGLFLRNGEIPTYGVDGTFGDMDDVRAHGRDERVGVKQFYEGLEFQYRLIKALSSR